MSDNLKTALDLNKQELAFYNVAALNTELTTLIGANKIREWSQLPSGVPSDPFIVIRPKVVTGPKLGNRTQYFTIYVYDAATQGFYRIKEIIKILEKIYTENCIKMCYTELVSIGAGMIDNALGHRPVQTIDFKVMTRR